MIFVVATKNHYLEYGLSALLKREKVIIARTFFIPDNRWHILEYDEPYVIICDSNLARLMSCMFHGRKYFQLDADYITGLKDIQNVKHRSVWEHAPNARALTMSEMVVMFGYIYRQSRPCRLASEMGVNTKTVNTFLYTGMAKNGLQGKSVKSLVGRESANNNRSIIRAGNI
ncbi:TPA: hypothetical protein L7312_005026 [Escherichia coli]|uniref:Uncharacterized protein n=1 Tax=Escherichia coli TaxID=562 RepID=A0A6L6ZP26_ECOLX|nr:hypothetical protein [Escherichia coli]MWU50585.1 hypothetical protein [Escherichia coli]MWU55450.1 hypothetical protein [Escherichia coli]HBI2839765.1 hypothetical protein [Escherichia coli]HBI2854073.1 hypothetical protein [Escherichia coli]